MEIKDFTPEWLKKVDCKSYLSDEVEVSFEDEPTSGELKEWLATHQPMKHQVRCWTKAQLTRKKKSLLRQIAREEAKIVEEHELREECIGLGMMLESLRAQRKSVRLPSSG